MSDDPAGGRMPHATDQLRPTASLPETGEVGPPPVIEASLGRPTADSADHGGPAFVAAGIVLGIGLGGFIDGIVLHQVLRWHHLLSSTTAYPATTVEGLEANTLADGLFHGATWVATAAGIVLLWRSVRRGVRVRSGANLAGWMLTGWGLFNLVEGIVDHHILQIHHVREGVEHTVLYDVGFLIFGAALVVVGIALGRRRNRRAR